MSMPTPGYSPDFSSNALDGVTDPDDISRPLYGASFGQAVRRYFKQYVNFTGRASRSEYWWVTLFTFLLSLIPPIITAIGGITSAAWVAANSKTTLIDTDSGVTTYQTSAGLFASPTAWLLFLGYALIFVIGLALLLPDLAITWRRLHDANLPGPFFFLGFIPFVGGLIVFIMTLLPSKPEGRRFDIGRYPGSSVHKQHT